MSHDKTTIPGSSRVRAIPDQVSSDTGGEFVVLSLESGRYHGFEEVAALIWSRVQKGATIEEIERAVTAEYDVAPEECHRDVQQFLADLRARGLIEIDETGAR